MKERYKLVTDDDGHWYCIPTGNAMAWEKWVDSGDPDEVPDWARRLNGSPSLVTFTDPEGGGL